MNSMYKKILLDYSGFFTVLIIWTIIFSFKLVHTLILPNPLEVTMALGNFFSDSEWILQWGATLARALLSFFLATAIGISCGLILGSNRILDQATEKLIDFLRSIPSIALFPLFILLLGVSESSRIAVATTVGSFIILISTKYGVLNANKIRKQMGKLYNLSYVTFLRKVLLPEAFPYIFNGMRIAISLSLLIIVVTEMLLGTNYGIGQILIKSQIQFQTEVLFATLIFLGILGTSLNFIFNKIEQKLFHWRST